MNEPSTGDASRTDKPSADPPRPMARWRRNAIIGLIGAPVLLAGLTVGGFSLFTHLDSRDPNPREFQSDGAGSSGAYYRIRIDYLPRGASGASEPSLARRLGAALFDEGLTTTLTVDVTHDQSPVEQLARWPGDGQAGFKGWFIAYRKQNQATIAVTFTRAAHPRLRWDIEPPQWATDILRALVPWAGADQPPLIRITPPAAGRQPEMTTIVVRDYKGVAIGDLHVTSQWRQSILFDPALVQEHPVPNPAIESFVKRNAGAEARKFAILRMIRSTAADFTAIAAIRSWIVQRFAALAGNQAQCAQTHDEAIDRFGLSASDAALLTYFLQRDTLSFTSAASLATVCGRESLGATLVRIGAPSTAISAPPLPAKQAPSTAISAPPSPDKQAPAPVKQAPSTAISAPPETPRQAPIPVKQAPAPVAAQKALPAARPARILQRLAREWKAGLAARTDSKHFIRTDARLFRPNRFNLLRTTPLADRVAILDDHAANRVHHFACFTTLAENSIAVIVERQQDAATAVFRYRFFFDKENKIYKIHRRPAIQADINILLHSLRGTPCTDQFLAREEARLRRVIGGDGLAEAPPAVAPAARILIESTRLWKSPAPYGQYRNRVKIDLDVLDSIPKNTSPRGGG